jgi:hypothetical protein
LVAVHPGGDHRILIGDVRAVHASAGDPLLYYAGDYRSLDSVDAAMGRRHFEARAMARDGMDTALPSGMKGEVARQRALQDRTASMCQSGVATQPLEERRARDECYDLRIGCCKASLPDVLGRRTNR